MNKAIPKKVESKSVLSSTQISFKLKLNNKHNSQSNSINSQSRSE